MERRADGQKLGAFGAALIGEFRGALDGGGISGDDDLLGRIDVGGFTDFALRGVLANGGDLRSVHAENGGHRTDSNRHGLLHILAAVAHGADGFGET